MSAWQDGFNARVEQRLNQLEAAAGHAVYSEPQHVFQPVNECSSGSERTTAEIAVAATERLTALEERLRERIDFWYGQSEEWQQQAKRRGDTEAAQRCEARANELWYCAADLKRDLEG